MNGIPFKVRGAAGWWAGRGAPVPAAAVPAAGAGGGDHRPGAGVPAVPAGGHVDAALRAAPSSSTHRPSSVGLDNFREIVADPYFWEVLRRTLLFCAVTVVAIMAVGTLIALLLGSARQGHAHPRQHRSPARLGHACAHRHRRLAVDLRQPARAWPTGCSPSWAATTRATPGCRPLHRSSPSPRSSSSGWGSRSWPSRSTPACRRSRPRCSRRLPSTVPARGSGSATSSSPPLEAAVPHPDRPQHAVEPAGVHADLRAAARRRHHPRDQHARGLRLPGVDRRQSLRHRRRRRPGDGGDHARCSRSYTCASCSSRRSSRCGRVAGPGGC